MYGQVETINQVTNAYFNSDFGEWCWVFMDGFWPITMAFSLPLSKAASKLGSKRPTSSILGTHTVSSACGVLVIHFFFLVMAFVLLFNQDWFQCRKWDGQDISLDYGLGDNYEVNKIHLSHFWSLSQPPTQYLLSSLLSVRPQQSLWSQVTSTLFLVQLITLATQWGKPGSRTMSLFSSSAFGQPSSSQQHCRLRALAASGGSIVTTIMLYALLLVELILSTTHGIRKWRAVE